MSERWRAAVKKVPSGRLRLDLGAALDGLFGGMKDSARSNASSVGGASGGGGDGGDGELDSRPFSGRRDEVVNALALLHAPSVVGNIFEFLAGPTDSEEYARGLVQLAPGFCNDAVTDALLEKARNLLPKLLAALLDPGEKVVWNAVEKRSTAKLLERVLSRIEALDDAGERAALTRAFRRTPSRRKDSDALRATVHGMSLRARDDDAHVRTAAVEVLGKSLLARVPPAGVADAVMRSLVRAGRDSDPYVRWVTGRVLGDAVGSGHLDAAQVTIALEQLQKLVCDDVGVVRRASVLVLATAISGEHAAKEDIPTATRVLLRAAKDPLKSVRTATAEAIGVLLGIDRMELMEEAMKTLADLADDSDSVVRSTAVETLAQSIYRSPRIALPALGGRADDESPLVRSTTIEAFGRVLAEGGVPVEARELVQSVVLSAIHDDDDSVRYRAVEAIASAMISTRGEDERLLASIIGSLKDKYWRVRSTAARNLGLALVSRIGHTDRIIDALREISADADADVRAAARSALEKRPRSIPRLTRSVSERSSVRSASFGSNHSSFGGQSFRSATEHSTAIVDLGPGVEEVEELDIAGDSTDSKGRGEW